MQYSHLCSYHSETQGWAQVEGGTGGSIPHSWGSLEIVGLPLHEVPWRFPVLSEARCSWKGVSAPPFLFQVKRLADAQSSRLSAALSCVVWSGWDSEPTGSE
ncbi:hypothetical protein AGIG_G8506 [Arapaima gigas]